MDFEQSPEAVSVGALRLQALHLCDWLNVAGWANEASSASDG